jgi:tetratricopeptide (TPR) repeat protein
VNVTDVDHLQGIANRLGHPHISEPEVAFIFQPKGSIDVDMKVVENQLRKAKRENPNSPQVYNQIGNFWRIEGDTQKSIECFRKALFLSPNNSDVLLNLARILFNLQYLDDAYELTRRSLEAQAPDQNSWLQHFTLAEIFKARGLSKDAMHHFHHSLDLHPGFQPAQKHLREMESSNNTDGTVTYYTICIIFMLVFGVLCCILTSIDSFDDSGDNVKTQRHFNRAMAMRSIKLGINPKLIRMRKQYGC